jgi:hypothetical protein
VYAARTLSSLEVFWWVGTLHRLATGKEVPKETVSENDILVCFFDHSNENLNRPEIRR